jgi:hypothetical protein
MTQQMSSYMFYHAAIAFSPRPGRVRLITARAVAPLYPVPRPRSCPIPTRAPSQPSPAAGCIARTYFRMVDAHALGDPA